MTIGDIFFGFLVPGFLLYLIFHIIGGEYEPSTNKWAVKRRVRRDIKQEERRAQRDKLYAAEYKRQRRGN